MLNCCRLRLLTNPDTPGVEKLSTTAIPREYLDEVYHDLPATIGGLNSSSLCLFVCSSHVFDQVNDVFWQEEQCCRRLALATARAGRGPLWHWYVCKQRVNWIWVTRSPTGSRRGQFVIWCVHAFSSSPRRGILRYNPLHLRLLQGCTFHSQCQSRRAVCFLRNAQARLSLEVLILVDTRFARCWFDPECDKGEAKCISLQKASRDFAKSRWWQCWTTVQSTLARFMLYHVAEKT